MNLKVCFGKQQLHHSCIIKSLTTYFLPAFSLTLAVTTSNLSFDLTAGSPTWTGLSSAGDEEWAWD